MVAPIFIGIAGGTGAGKSTVCYGLVDKYPEKMTIVHLDDYHKKKETIPHLHGMPNWDHPDAIDFQKLLNDLSSLKKGEKIIVQTKNERFNPRAKEIGRIPMEILPKPIILVEGYLALYHPDVRAFFSHTIFLDVPYETRIARRTKFMDPLYQEKILVPMHKQYVEPTTKYAQSIIDVSVLNKEQVLQELEKIINS
jgi:uridine kinase